MDYVCKECLECAEEKEVPESLKAACDHYIPALGIILDQIFIDDDMCVLEKQSLCNGMIFFIHQELKARALNTDIEALKPYH